MGEKIANLIKITEKALLAIIAALTVIATGEEVLKIYYESSVQLADLLLLFIYTEVLGMIGIFFVSNRIPITLPIFIAMTAISRLIILQGKEMDMSFLLYEAGAILVLAIAVLVVRYKPLKTYIYQTDDDR
ncbi:phosphate-starvation-inducible PsiE family protein [Candidatus Puniceispirillum sp.]|nr:phosphate-starvation-inducible PsiE family protein [Candidatus Puniceispirillum sp.]